MPTKRQFDLVVIMLLLAAPVKGLWKLAATRRVNDPNVGSVGTNVAAAVKIGA